MRIEAPGLCADCPMKAVLGDNFDKLFDITLTEGDLPAIGDVLAGRAEYLSMLSRTAMRIECEKIPKVIPDPPKPMPPVGHPERIAFGRLCPAYLFVKFDSGST
ncbi:hypothetical protein KDA23_04490 [Candidatus Saccharibacteria bacterium]|nr:hypothetical protein [Candidatus Saccharibacteria bacterium]